MDTQEGAKKKKFYQRWWFWVLAVVVLFIIIGASSGGSSSNGSAPVANSGNAQPVEALKVTAAKLSSDYKANEVSADAKYKDKLLEISGTVDTIGKDILDTPYIAFSGGEYDILDRVQCMFSKAAEPQLATVSKGQNITLRGTVSGKLGNIIIKGCSIVE